MKLSIAKSELAEALGIVGKGMSARSTLPILSGILLTASEDGLQLQATDLEISVRHNARSLIEQEGKVVVPGRLLSDIVRSMPDAAVSIETDGEIAHVRAGHAAFTVKTLPAADFPKFPEIDVEKRAKLPSTTFASIVKQVAKAVSRDETRAILTGVLMSIDGSVVRMVATDSYRLAVREVMLDEPAGESIEVVVPGKAVDEVAKMLGGSESVEIGVSDNQVVFNFADTEFVTRRVEGTYPNWKQLIPNQTDTKVVVSREELQEAVKRVSLLALHNSPLKISVLAEDQTLSLSAATQDVGDASEDLMVKVQGNDVEIAFNHAFLTDGLLAAHTDNVVLEIQSALKPGLVKTEGDDGFVYLLMPVRLN